MSKKIIVYGSENCPDCVVLTTLFDKAGIHYGYVDILASLAHMKKFINLRDSNPDAFAEIREKLKVGIPTVVVDDTEIYPEYKVENDDISIFL